jgi:RNA polymerase sigma-70 factor (ECF subfamily)
VVAASQVPEHALGFAANELAFQVCRKPLAGLRARRHPRPHHEFHGPLDAPTAHRDSSYALGRAFRLVGLAGMPEASSDDAALLARARGGDLDAFAEIVRHHEQRVRAVLFRLLDDERDVEEATQDCFVQAWRHLDRFRGEATIFSWLYRIAVNEALARLRRKQLPVTGLDEGKRGRSIPAEARDEPDHAAEAHALQAFLAARIRALPLDDRAALVLRDLAGLSNAEVADVLDVSVAAAKSRIHRARMTIREDLERWERGS